MINPFLSIIICTYNRPDFLMDCIQSIVKQMVSDVEILVVDNFGDLKIQEKIQQFKYLDINIQYLFEKNKGLSNLNGPFISGLPYKVYSGHHDGSLAEKRKQRRIRTTFTSGKNF